MILKPDICHDYIHKQAQYSYEKSIKLFDILKYFKHQSSKNLLSLEHVQLNFIEINFMKIFPAIIITQLYLKIQYTF